MENQKSWLGKILASIIELFASNWESFAVKLFKKIPDELKEKISIGIVIVENIKKFIESPAADFLTAIIPGDLDDKIKDKLRFILPVIWERYNLANQTKLKAEASHIIATNINKEITGLSFGQTALTTEVAYQAFKKEQKA